MQNEWMTTKDVAEHLKVSLPTVYRWADAGILTRHKIGRFNRFLKSEVDAAVGSDSGSGQGGLEVE